MEAIIILFLFFLNFFKTIHSRDSCPTSSCGSDNLPRIKHPFKLQSDPLPNGCQGYINLRCNSQNQTIINLPSSGDFYVTHIDYSMRRISLSDPQNCIPGRLIMTTLSFYPLEALRYENYTYHLCPRKPVPYGFTEIECLSNSTNVTIITSFPNPNMERIYGCRMIITSVLPVLRTEYHRDWGASDYLQLTWKVSGCKDCDAQNFRRSDSQSKLAKIFKSPVLIISAATAVLFAAACLLRFTDLVTRANTNSTTENNRPPGSVTEPPQTSRETQRSSTNGIRGIDDAELKSCTEVVVLSEEQGTCLPVSLSCSVCLEEYQGKGTVRYFPHCRHYFHVECVDEWLKINSTCPVCRASLLD